MECALSINQNLLIVYTVIIHYTYHKSLVKLVTLEIFKCEISNDAVAALTPKKGGVGLSYLGLTGCDIVDVIFLETIASKFIFSAFINDDTFVGFQPIKSELESREHVRREYIQLLATTKIQRMIRGKLVRMGIYKEKKNKWAGKLFHYYGAFWLKNHNNLYTYIHLMPETMLQNLHFLIQS